MRGRRKFRKFMHRHHKLSKLNIVKLAGGGVSTSAVCKALFAIQPANCRIRPVSGSVGGPEGLSDASEHQNPAIVCQRHVRAPKTPVRADRISFVWCLTLSRRRRPLRAPDAAPHVGGGLDELLFGAGEGPVPAAVADLELPDGSFLISGRQGLPER